MVASGKRQEKTRAFAGEDFKDMPEPKVKSEYGAFEEINAEAV